MGLAEKAEEKNFKKERKKRVFIPIGQVTKKSGLVGHVQFKIYQLLGFYFLWVRVSQVLVCNGRMVKMITNKKSKKLL